MRKILSVFLLSFLLFTCDDGDIIDVELDFDDTFEACGELVFFKTKSDPPESLSIFLTSPTLVTNQPLRLEDFLTYSFDADDTDMINPIIEHPEVTFEINGSANRFNYRTYNIEPLNFFCEDVAPSNIQILTDYESTDGQVIITTSIIEDDNDGIPAWFEDANTDGDNDPSTNATDTDGDGIPDYLDEDDDGDNVRTVNENPNFDETIDNLVDPQDTDGDGVPDYLDSDDDDDGVLTIDEDEDEDQNPLNDITNDAVLNPDNIADFLNNNISNEYPATAYRAHKIYQDFVMSIEVLNIDLPILYEESLDFGTLEDSSLSEEREITPTFP